MLPLLGTTMALATMPCFQLNTGASIPALAFGTWQLNGQELKQAVQCAIDQGYRHFDTSAGYENERVVGDGIAESGIPREEFFITTKLWCTDHGEEQTFGAILSSMSELNTDYVDCYLMHAPTNLGETPEEIIELRRQSWEVMEQFHGAGALRSIGVSNFEPHHIEHLLSCGTVVPALNQVELHAHFGQHELRDYCAARGITVAAYGSVGAGAATDSALIDDPSVVSIAKARGRTPAQVSLRHGLERGCVVLARSVTPERIAENAALFDFELSAEDMDAMDALERGERSYWDNSEVP
jgi:2,5-diketo-D-gluconate reductase A